jgi:hypothetical protein
MTEEKDSVVSAITTVNCASNHRKSQLNLLKRFGKNLEIKPHQRPLISISFSMYIPHINVFAAAEETQDLSQSEYFTNAEKMLFANIQPMSSV